MTITPYAMMRYMEMDKDDVGCGSVFGLRPECSLQDINRVVKNNTEGENIHNKLELIIPNIRITYSVKWQRISAIQIIKRKFLQSEKHRRSG